MGGTGQLEPWATQIPAPGIERGNEAFNLQDRILPAKTLAPGGPDGHGHYANGVEKVKWRQS